MNVSNKHLGLSPVTREQLDSMNRSVDPVWSWNGERYTLRDRCLFRLDSEGVLRTSPGISIDDVIDILIEGISAASSGRLIDRLEPVRPSYTRHPDPEMGGMCGLCGRHRMEHRENPDRREGDPQWCPEP